MHGIGPPWLSQSKCNPGWDYRLQGQCDPTHTHMNTTHHAGSSTRSWACTTRHIQLQCTTGPIKQFNHGTDCEVQLSSK